MSDKLLFQWLGNEYDINNKQKRKENKMSVMYGPIQMFLFGFDNAKVKKDLKNALLDLSKKGLIRILDIAYVSKSQQGNIKIREGTELDEVEQVKLGAAIGALIGLGAGGEAGMEAGIQIILFNPAAFPIYIK